MAKLVPRLTMILRRARGDLIVLIRNELRRVASRLRRRKGPDHTLPAAAVLHQALIRLLAKGALKTVDQDWRPARARLAGRLGGSE